MTVLSHESRIRPFHSSLIDDLRSLLERLKHDQKEQYLKTLVIVPTRRAVKDLKFALSHNAHTPSLLPHIVSVSDLPTHILGDRPAILPEHQRLALAYNVLKDLGETPSFSYAKELLTLRDQMTTHVVDINELDQLVPEIYAAHWQQTSSFLKTFTASWQEALTKQGALEQSAGERDAFRSLSLFWQEHPPQTPVIAAGLDGFIPAIKTLMDDIVTLPQGHVLWTGVLPTVTKGFCGKTHPNYLASRSAQDIQHHHPADNLRSHLLSHMFSDHPYDDRDVTGITFKGLSVYQGKSLSQEAEMVALLAREAVQNPSKTVAIVTPDQDLTNRIQKELALLGIRVDVAGGTAIIDKPEARYGLRLLDVDLFAIAPLTALSLLKDPLTSWAQKQTLLDHEGDIRSGRDLDIKSLSTPWDHIIQPLVHLKAQETCSLVSLNTCWDQLCETLSEKVHTSSFYQDVRAHLHSLESILTGITLADYKSLLTLLMTSVLQRDAVNHPRVRLMSPIQSAFSRFDRVILAGLNEGVWPVSISENPWLNLDMQLKLGLPDTQIMLGRGAWLLAQNMRAPEVFLTYADRRGGDPVTPSRWILRLKALERAILTQNPNHKAGALSLDPSYQNLRDQRSQSTRKRLIQEPHPCPPCDVRPKRFSVTDIERLLLDPYQIYAKSVLKLYPLPDITEPKTQADFGTFVHGCLEDHLKEKKPFSELVHKNMTRLKQGHMVYGLSPIDTALQVLWQKTIARFEPWLADILHQQALRSLTSKAEHALNLTFEIDQTPVTIIGKADRIDHLQEGTYEIIDYKTGHTPSKKDVMTGRSPQLAILGKLFMLLNPGAVVSKLTYISLGSQTVSSFEARPLIDDTWAQVRDVLSHYRQPHTTFDINVMASLRDPYNRYHHLERTSEWLEAKQDHTQGPITKSIKVPS